MVVIIIISNSSSTSNIYIIIIAVIIITVIIIIVVVAAAGAAAVVVLMLLLYYHLSTQIKNKLEDIGNSSVAKRRINVKNVKKYYIVRTQINSIMGGGAICSFAELGEGVSMFSEVKVTISKI